MSTPEAVKAALDRMRTPGQVAYEREAHPMQNSWHLIGHERQASWELRAERDRLQAVNAQLLEALAPIPEEDFSGSLSRRTSAVRTIQEPLSMSAIDNITIADARAIAAMFGANAPAVNPHPFVGRYVVIRCYSAGVHAGVLVSQTGDQAVLKDARRLWSWRAKSGVALSGLSQSGIDVSKSKVDTMTPEHAYTGVIETIPCSSAAEESIRAA